MFRARAHFKHHPGVQLKVKLRFTLLGGKKAICRCGGPRAQGLVRAGVVPTKPPVSRKSLARDEPSFGLRCADQAFFVRFLFEVCWLLSFFSPEVPV